MSVYRPSRILCVKLQRVVGFFGQNTQSLIILSPATGENHFLLVLSMQLQVI